MKKVLSLALVFGFISCGLVALGNVEARGSRTHRVSGYTRRTSRGYTYVKPHRSH